MLEWIGSLRIRERSSSRVVLGLSRTTRAAGLVVAALGVAIALPLWDLQPSLAVLSLALTGLGLGLASLDRTLVIDREAGVLQVDQRLLGIGTRTVVPLFHLRAVVVTARSQVEEPGRPGGRYLAYLDRRVGESIYLDEARRCAGLLRLAEVIADIAELRLEYEATG